MPNHDIEHEAKSIFISALDCSTAADRREYVRSVCANNERLRAHVETLLQAHDAPAILLEPPAIDLAHTSHPTEGPGTVIGRYKLVELIGEGGFGDIYMAEQQEPVRRQVALKIIKLGMDTKQVIARFEAERQALAMMDHPNIAKVLDAGATDSGRPYFVMELLQGVPITEYCDSNRLTTKARLKLFIAVCHAVLHAHQKGIIHRDIKPTNVMVTLHDGQPVPKVIDFGIARATQQRLTERTVSTGYGQMIGTPQYMSPEQAEMCDQDIDTRTDIYSLGVLLYELLVGTTPFEPDELRSVGYDQMCRIIRENNPPRPSRRLSTLGDLLTTVSQRRQVQPAVLRKQLQGDLDWIVMKALEKDRTRRYETVKALTLDTERYLNEEPVLARAPSTAYRLKKFMFKHRVPVAAAAAVLASGSFDNSVKLWDMVTHKVRAELGRPLGPVYSLAFSPSGATLAVGSQDSRVWLWDLATKKTEPQFSGHSSHVTSLAFSSDGTTLASGSADGTVKIADVTPFQGESNDEGHSDWLTRIAISSTDGGILAVGSGEMVTESMSGEILLWDVATREERSLTGGGTGPIYGVALSPDGQVLATGGMVRGSWAGVLRLWDVPSGKLLRTLEGHTGGVFSLTFSPDGKTLASADWGRPDAKAPDSEDWGATIRLWDTATGELRESLSSERFAATSIAFAPGGESLAIGGGRWERGEIKLWNVTGDKAPVILAGPSGMVWDVVFSPDGKTLAAADWSGSVTLWDVVRGRKELTIDAHSHHVFSVAFTPAGKTLASGSLDSTVKLSHLATGGELATLKAHVPIMSVAFFPDGNTLAGGGSDKSVTLWHVDAEKEVLRAGSK